MARDLAFLIIDVQAGMFSMPEQPYRGGEILEVIARLADRARAASIPIIYVRHDGGAGDPLARGTSGWEIHPSIAPKAGERIVEKRHPNSFQETDLREILDSLAVSRLILTGLQSEFCVGATSLAAKALGYEVTVVTDAHSTFDGPGGCAEKLIEDCNRAFGEHGIHLKTAREVLF
ncbi:MAG: cysteine hydrolase family protein [Candidatus Binataceae bacterium]